MHSHLRNPFGFIAAHQVNTFPVRCHHHQVRLSSVDCPPIFTGDIVHAKGEVPMSSTLQIRGNWYSPPLDLCRKSSLSNVMTHPRFFNSHTPECGFSYNPPIELYVFSILWMKYRIIVPYLIDESR